MRVVLVLLIVVVLVQSLYIFVYKSYLSPVGDSNETGIFIVEEPDPQSVVSEKLKDEGYIKNSNAFNFIHDFIKPGRVIKPGGYRLRRNMNTWEVFEKVTADPDLAWVKITFCARKEQVGEIVGKALGWGEENLKRWNEINKFENTDYYEGVFYPDTYLLPKDETEAQIAARLIGRFNERISPLTGDFLNKNIPWTTGVNIAALIEREAGGVSDMKTISGVIWNRLESGMRLQIDATMQYTHGKREDGTWWGPISLEEKRKDSPYNTYLHKGLPPTPICSPGINAIEAALNPEDTDCLFYLHDSLQNIHCAKTYEEHKENIDKYLRF
jgi:UPF0755 protein